MFASLDIKAHYKDRVLKTCDIGVKGSQWIKGIKQSPEIDLHIHSHLIYNTGAPVILWWWSRSGSLLQ